MGELFNRRPAGNFIDSSDTPNAYTGESGKTATVKATEDGLEFTTPAGSGDMLVATYDPASKATQLLATSDIVTTIANPGLDTKVPSEQGVREALNAVDQKKLKATYFAAITSGTTTGTITKPAGAGADVDFIMDEWGTATDALVSTVEDGKPTFKSPVDTGGNTITTTFDTAGNYTFSATPSPAADHALIYVYTCFIKNFNVAEALWETELLDYVADHASTHTNGSDDIQSATNAQKGLATAAHITAIEANTTHKTSDGSDHAFIDQDMTSGASPTLDGANITNIDADTLVADVKEANISAVKKGQPCAIVGSSGVKFEVQLADCDNVNLIRLLGIAEVDTAQNETGTVIHKGLLINVDTQTTNSDLNPGAETWAAGQLLYVSQTPGGLTKTPPTSGRCIKACRSQKGNSASDILLVIVHTNPIRACAASGEDICSRMGDSAGANKHSFKDYVNNEVAAIDSNGNLTLDGTVDGRDIDADGTKLDGIEAAATADQTKADIDGLGLSHDSLADASTDDHHAQSHSIVSHSDTTATGAELEELTDGSNTTLHKHKRTIQLRLLDKDTSHTVSNSIGGDFRFTQAMTVTGVSCYFDTAGTDSVTTLDINEAGTTILSTKLTVDATEKTSETAAAPAVISDSVIAANAIITFDLDGIASGTAGKGLVIELEVTTP